HFPFALDSVSAGGPEPESGIVVCVPQNDDAWAARVLEFAVSRFDQFAADTLALVLRTHRHWAQSRPRNLVTDRQRTVHDVTHHSTVECCDQGECSGSVGPQGIYDVGFLVLPECALVQVTNRRDVTRTLFS